MTYSLKAFIVNANFVNNTPGVTAPFGELSPYSMTFSQEVGAYTAPGVAATLAMMSFTSQTNGVDTVVNAGVATRTLTIAQWVYTQTVAQSGQLFADQLLSQLLINFNASANTFACGNIMAIGLPGGTYYIPEWLSWIDIATGGVIKIWFVDASFQTQYDDFTIIVVPPITPISNFFSGATNVLKYVNAVTYPAIVDAIQAASNGKPYSIVRAETFNYVDPTNPANLIPTNWTVLIYGPMGDNVDSISDALSTYCLANSSYTQAQWVAILPDIFLRTEFIFVPFFDQYGIPNTNSQDGIYSPQLKVQRALSLVTAQIPSYAASHIDTYLNVMSYPYRSLQVGVIGSVNNKNSWFELIDVFPDIIGVPSTSIDFARMALDTQNFLLNLGTMIIAAETMTAFSDIPAGFTRNTRDGNLYLVMTYQNIHYLVAAKQNLTTVITGVVSS
jgi:hypothetical protein